MNVIAKLSPREYEVAELLAWGASKKEVADHLCISIRTVENHTRSIFEKLGCNSVNELSALWFCDKYNISMRLSPRKCKFITIALLLLMMPQMYKGDDNVVRIFRTRTTTTRTCRQIRRKSESDIATFYFTI